MDYNLTGLGTRTFEHLAQALFLREFGTGALVFGDGADGGREASFEGGSNYDDGSGVWNGYIVAQAKFRQRESGARSDKDWFLDQLKAELEEFTKQGAKRRLPEYYLVVTNVALSGNAGTGGKDAALRVIRQTGVGRKGVDIWDYSKLRSLLDASEDVRRNFAAFISSSDVLNAALEGVAGYRPDFSAVMTRFLQLDLLAAQYAKLEQGGHSPDDRIPIAPVFVDLPLKTDRRGASDDERFIAKVYGVASRVLRPSAQSVDHKDRAPGRIVLIGGPGQGKTTLGQYACQLFRASILLTRPPESVDPESLALAEAVQRAAEADSYGLPAVHRFPVHVPLSEFASALAEAAEVTSVLTFLRARIALRTDTHLELEMLRSWLRDYPWLIVLDGLDEVPTSSNRGQVVDAIRQFMIEVAEADADVFVIATTRPQGYDDEFNPSIYTHLRLDELSRAGALEYAERLVRVRFGEEPDRVDRVLRKLSEAAAAEATLKLMTSPLQVTIMAILVDRRGTPPRERWSLFSEYYNVIFYRELERDLPSSTVVREQASNVHVIHRTVGLLLHVDSDTVTSTQAKMSLEQFSSVVSDRLEMEGYVGPALTLLTAQIVEAAALRLVFLVGVEQGLVGFEIRSLQEFMAGEALMAGTELAVQERLRAIAPLPSWRNVFLFAAGKCFTERQELRDTIYTICCELDDGDDSTLRLTAAGSRLALDLLEEGTVNGHPRYRRSLLRRAFVQMDGRLSVSEAAETGQRLALLYDEAVDDVYREELRETTLDPAGVSDRGLVLGCLAGFGVPWAVDAARMASSEVLLSLFKRLPEAPVDPEMVARLHAAIESCDLETAMELHNELRSLADDGLAEPWVDAIVEAQARNADADHRIEIGHSGRRMVMVGVRGVDSLTAGAFEPLEVLNAPHPSWEPLQRLAAYAAEPSPATVGAVLRSIARTSPATVPVRPRGRHNDDRDSGFLRWPWPITTLLVAAVDAQHLEILAAEVEAGAHGDASLWRANEERWAREHSSFRDFLAVPWLRTAPERRLPPIHAVYEQFAALSAGKEVDLSVVAVANELVACSDPVAREAASLILYWLTLQDRVHRIEAIELVGDCSIADMCRLVGSDAVGLGGFHALELILADEDLSETDAAAIAALGGAYDIDTRAGWGAGPRLGRLVEAATAQRERAGEPFAHWLRLLMAVGQSPEWKVDPNSLVRCGDCEDSELVLAFALVFGADRDATAAINRLALACEGRPEVAQMVALDTTRIGSPRAEEGILQVLVEATNDPEVRDVWRDSLADLVSRRRSPLDDQTRWADFGLRPPPYWNEAT